MENRRRFGLVTNLFGGGGAAATVAISATGATANVAAMQVVFSKAVTGFEVGDITISGGSLADFATADNITYTVNWTLAAGTNTMDIAAGVCAEGNTAADQYTLVYTTLQPDGANGKDATIYSGATGFNYGTALVLDIGSYVGTATEGRALVQFDLSGIPAGSTVLSSILSLYATADNSTNASVVRAFRLKRAWVEGTRSNANDSPATGATWTRYDTTNNWATAGGFHADDCEQTAIGSLSLGAAETINEFKSWTLTASKIQEMIPSGAFANNGFLLKVDNPAVANNYTYAASDNATAGNRPKLAVVYHP